MQEWLFLGTGVVIAVLGGIGFYFWRATRKLEEQLLLAESENRSLQEQLQTATLLRDNLLQALPSGLLVLDSQQRIIYTNPAAEALLGQDLVGKTLIAATRHLELDSLTQKAPNGSSEPIEKTIEIGQKYINARAMRFKTVRDSMTILSLIDETELRRLGRARREMVANISHELRTPITTISLLAETLMGELGGKSKAARKMVKDIQREAATLTQLVQEMRDLSLIESGQMPAKLTPTNLSTIIQNSLEPLMSLAERKEQKVNVELEQDYIALADADQIQRVLKNIIHNAIKFTQNGGTITISAQANDEEITLSVRDNGPGIAEENISRIFERFFQASLSRSDGTGLGLAIARHIVLAHGGKIWAESSPGQGATFYFTLAHAEAPQPN